LTAIGSTAKICIAADQISIPTTRKPATMTDRPTRSYSTRFETDEDPLSKAAHG
jgi:hypothetical protein